MNKKINRPRTAPATKSVWEQENEDMLQAMATNKSERKEKEENIKTKGSMLEDNNSASSSAEGGGKRDELIGQVVDTVE